MSVEVVRATVRGPVTDLVKWFYGYVAGRPVKMQATLRTLLKPVEPPIPPEPEGGYVVADAREILWSMADVIAAGGWAALWLSHGPLTVFRR